MLNIDRRNGAPYHPQSQGKVERLNKTIETWLGKVTTSFQTERWIDHLPSVILTYNLTRHDVTGE